MDEPRIRFDDGAAYERMMGAWSRIAGERFLAWLAPARGLRWLDVGCGNGAFTELLVARCAPASVDGIDPSGAQLDYARKRAGVAGARFREGDAMALPYEDRTFDVAAMALVLFFVPDAAKAVAEMRRVVAPGGIVAAYSWDMMNGGFPIQGLLDEFAALGIEPPLPPSAEASRVESKRELWARAGLEDVHVVSYEVERAFQDFDDWWNASLGAARIASIVKAMSAPDLARLRDRMRARLPAARDGRLACTARANAIRGRVPAP